MRKTDRTRTRRDTMRIRSQYTRSASSGEAAGLLVLLTQTAVCVVVLAVIFTVQFFEPGQYQMIGEYYAQVIAEAPAENETTRLLSTEVTWQAVSDWWQNIDPDAVMEVFLPQETAMGGEETVFPRNATYNRVLVSAQARSPLPCDAVITSPYGERDHPITKAWDFHTGIDLAAPAGTAIRSIYPGRVIQTGWSSAYGNYIVVQHSDNLQSIYCHCSRILLAEGNKVASGQTIAEVGSTGISTGPHLHLSVLVDGCYVDPMHLYAS